MVAERGACPEHGEEALTKHRILAQRGHQRRVLLDDAAQRRQCQIGRRRFGYGVEQFPGKVEVLGERDRERRVLEAHPGHDRPGGRGAGRATAYC